MDTQYQQDSIGNPVDVWWNATRREIIFCIDLLAHFPPAPNSNLAGELIESVQYAHDYVTHTPYPQEATKVREFLLESLSYLIESLREQRVLGLLVSESTHNMAYHKFLMVTFKLLQSGIYEPAPSDQAIVD